MLRLSAVILILTSASLSAEPSRREMRVGDVYELSLIHMESSRRDDGSSSSNGRDSLVEKVIAITDKGVELEYDLPAGATEKDRLREWTLPARIFKPAVGTPQLLNAPELEKRLGHFLKAARWDRAVCGKWIFTWNAFRIECDPQSVLTMIERFDLGPCGLTTGTVYEFPGTLQAAPLVRRESDSGGNHYDATFVVDPEAIRQAQVESDVVVGEIVKEPVTPEQARRKHAAEHISGTITVTLETDSSGCATRRTATSQVTIKADGKLETRSTTQTLERKLQGSRADQAASSAASSS